MRLCRANRPEGAIMSNSMTRRSFTTLAAGLVLGSATGRTEAHNMSNADAPMVSNGPTEAPFTRDYSPPDFKPSWKKPQINRLLVQDFVIYAHSDLVMTK